MIRVLRLAAFASLGWALPVIAQIPQLEYAERRQTLVSEMRDGVLLAFGASAPRHDYLSFHQASPFLYLTGHREPDAALVMVKRGAAVTTTMFVQPRDPAREVWEGSRHGPEGVTRVTGMAARVASELRPVLDSLIGFGLPLYVVGEFDGGAHVLSADQQFVLALRDSNPALEVLDAGDVVRQMRARKSAAELALLRKAIAITIEAHREAMRALEPGMNEFELEALVEYTFRRNGADRPGFASIVGSGPNATTLHYNDNDRFMSAGEVVVIDIGASYRGYTADVTRTLPVSGTFSPAQREIYQVVRDAQAAAERQARVGAQAGQMDDSARAVIAAGLTRLGLIESPTATYDAPAGSCGGATACARPQWFLYYMHGLGHGIGLDVHDPDQSRMAGRIAPGSAFTLEPGIYVRANVLEIIPDTPRNRALAARIRTAVQRFANIGVRIEDDYVVTEKGLEWVSRVPREIGEIEALMREPFSGPAKRNPAMVEWYRETGNTP